MGVYIETGANHGKAVWLMRNYGAKTIAPPKTLKDIDPEQALICVVDNGYFEAAGWCRDENELNAFKYPDGRPRQWLLMDKKSVEELTGVKG